MTQEEKKLLLKDICARLPYGVQVLADIDKTFDDGIVGKVVAINLESELVYLEGVLTPFSLDEIRPYLKPWKNMTKNESSEYYFLCIPYRFCGETLVFLPTDEATDFLLSRHIDTRGLISKSLALPALEGMYNLKKGRI